MFPVCLSHAFANQRIVATTQGRRELQPHSRVVHLINLYRHHLVKLFEAALDLGCDPRQAFFKVILPEISPAILSGFLISLTYSIDDFMISYFNCGTVATLPIAIYSMTRKKVSPEIYALSTIMFEVILSVILESNAMESRSYRRDQKTLRKEGAR